MGNPINNITEQFKDRSTNKSLECWLSEQRCLCLTILFAHLLLTVHNAMPSRVDLINEWRHIQRIMG